MTFAKGQFLEAVCFCGAYSSQIRGETSQAHRMWLAMARGQTVVPARATGFLLWKNDFRKCVCVCVLS